MSNSKSATTKREFDRISAQAVQRPTRDAFSDPRKGATVCAASSPPDSEIQGLLKAQDSDICSLQSTVDHLHNRLGSILIPVPGTESANKNSPTGSEIGANIQNHNERIESVIDQLSGIINQLAI